MAIKFGLTFLLVVGLSAALAFDFKRSIPDNEKACKQLPKLVTNATENLQPFGDQWRLYKSLRPIERCIRFQYISDPNNPLRAEGILTHKLLGTFVANITVKKEMNEWDVYNSFDGRKADFYTLKYNKENNYWCVYTCEHNEKFIEDIRCLALDNKGKDALEKDIESSPGLPLKPHEKLLTVYDDQCDTKSV